MAERGEKPGYLEGLAKEFFWDVPYSVELTRGEQHLREAIRGNALTRIEITELQGLQTGQSKALVSTERALQEVQKTRETAEQTIAPLLRDVALGNMAIDGRLQRLHSAIEKGLMVVEKGMKGMQGIPTEREDVDQLLANGTLDEEELVILAARNILDPGQRKKLQDSLEPWKLDIIKSGLATNPDFKIEKTLTIEEKLFLAKLRRKTTTPIEYFRSLEPAARHGLIEPEVHHALAKELRGLRFGIEGTNYGIRELNEQTDALVRLGGERSKQGQISIAQRATQVEQGQIAITQRDTALRLERVGILQRHKLIEVGIQAIGIQANSLTAQQNIADGVENLRILGERASTQRDAIVAHTGKIEVHTEMTARHTGVALLLAERAEVQRNAILGEIEKLGLQNEHFGGVHARQMDEAQVVRLQQLQIERGMLEVGQSSNLLLERIGEGVINLARLEELQLEGLQYVGEGVEVLAEIGKAHLETLIRIESILDTMAERLTAEGRNIANAIESVRASLLEIEARSTERSRNRDQTAADESFREAMIMLKVGEIDDAIDCFGKSIERWRADFRPYLQRGLCYVIQSKVEDAKNDFDKALKLAPDGKHARARAVIRLNLARLIYAESKVAFQSGDTKQYEDKLLEAIEEAKRAVDEDPEFLEGHFVLATYLASFKLLDESLKILVKIIPKDPRFARRIDHFEIFADLRNSLKLTLKEEFAKGENPQAKANLSVARDVLWIGDIETAIKCIQNLLDENPQFLNASKFWKFEEFSVIGDRIIQMISETIDFAEYIEAESCEYWYAITGIALHYFPDIDRSEIYDAFLRGAKSDPNFMGHDIDAIRQTLSNFADDRTEILFDFVRRKHPSDFTWLIDKI